MAADAKILGATKHLTPVLQTKWPCPSKTYFSNIIVVYAKVTLLTLWDNDCPIFKLRLLTSNGDQRKIPKSILFFSANRNGRQHFLQNLQL